MSVSGAEVGDETTARSPVLLEPAQVRFFETFGFLVLRGLMADDIATISDGFDEVFAAHEPIEYRHDLHFNEPREMIGPGFVDRSPKLAWLREDPRIVGIVHSLIGPDHDYHESDGNRFSCDTAWHSDLYGATMERLHVKVYFYLDPLSADSGALRLMPGTNSSGTSYADSVRAKLWDVSGSQEHFGVDVRDIPCHVVETEPGDVVVGDYRTLHATFGGAPGRRLCTINFSKRGDTAPGPG